MILSACFSDLFEITGSKGADGLHLGRMLPPHRVPVGASRRQRMPPRQQILYYVIALLGVVAVLSMLRFLYGKCDTRVHMSLLLTKTARILKRHNVEYWLDKGTLLGVHRDDDLIPWEYDVDLGVMNVTCAAIAKLKSDFEAVGLTAYDRDDDIPHKVKLTYDTENHELYWSDPRLHDPCIRIYDKTDMGTWVDIYWYVEVTPEEVAADRENVLVPRDYDESDSLVCCAEGLQAHTAHMCCGGCVPRKSLFPLQRKYVNVHDGIDPVQEQPVPAAVAQFLSIQYGESALTSREIKGWKFVVCGFWTSPLLFMVHLTLLNGVLMALVIVCRRKYCTGSFKRRKL